MTAALLGLICVAASAVILVALHLLPTGLDSIRYAVSDYGWTRFSLGYHRWSCCRAAARSHRVRARATYRREVLGWLYVYGVVRLLIAGFMTDREPEGLRSLTRTGRIHIILAGTAFASVAVAASHIDWSGKPDVLGPLGWLVTATAIATAVALTVLPIRRVALGLIERTQYASAIAWLIVVAASII